MAQILDGKVVRDKIAEELKAEISKLDQKPYLAIIQVGDLPESNTYIGQKVKFGEKIGIIVKPKKFPEKITQEELIGQIKTYNQRPDIHGIIVQLPMPDGLDKNKIIEAIDPLKDVDGQTSKNIKALIENENCFTPATTKGIFTLLDFYKIPVEGKHVVIVGRSTLVGKPTAFFALNKDATVTIAHSKTGNLPKTTKSADILIVAVGKPKLITKEHVSKNQVVVDVGINVVGSGSDPDQGPTLSTRPETEPAGRKLVGDVDFESVSKIVAAISPVPGGAGPMTVASLFQNLLDAYNNQT